MGNACRDSTLRLLDRAITGALCAITTKNVFSLGIEKTLPDTELLNASRWEKLSEVPRVSPSNHFNRMFLLVAPGVGKNPHREYTADILRWKDLQPVIRKSALPAFHILQSKENKHFTKPRAT